jgi:hypothetical protein
MRITDRIGCLCCGKVRDAAVRSSENPRAYVCAICIDKHAPAAQLGADMLRFPKTLTEPVREVLSLMLWETSAIAHALRAAGHTVDRKVEDEQAVALHWLLGFALEHGADWQRHEALALREITQAIGDRDGTPPTR